MRVQLIAKREANLTGTSRYASDLFRGFKEMGFEASLTFPPLMISSPVVHRWFKTIQIDPQTFFASYPIRVSLEGADIYHLTNQMLATILLFQRFPRAVIVSVLDIIPYLVRHEPNLNTFRHPAEYLFYRLALAGLRKASCLIAISKYTRQTMLEKLELPPERIHVVYPSVDQNKFRPLEVPEPFFQKYGLDAGRRYILYVGSEDPRKNLPTLIRAFALVKQQLPGMKLLKVGSAHYQQERRKLLNLIASLDLNQDVIFLNYIPEEDLPLFYNSAEVLVMPSLYEGFGLPAVEAMACSTPVVCARAGSLPEVVGGAGILVDPGNAQAMAEALVGLLNNPTEMQRRKDAGRVQADNFTVEKAICTTQKIYTQTIERFNGAGSLESGRQVSKEG